MQVPFRHFVPDQTRAGGTGLNQNLGVTTGAETEFFRGGAIRHGKRRQDNDVRSVPRRRGCGTVQDVPEES